MSGATTAAVTMRRKTEQLLAQRFKNLDAVLDARKQYAVDTLRARIEAKTDLAKVKKRLDALKIEKRRIETEIEGVETRESAIDERVTQQVDEQTAALNAKFSEAEQRLGDRKNELIEQLWVGSLDADLRALVDRVPSAEDMMKTGLEQEMKHLLGQR